MDAKLPFILVEALKRDLDLSDSQLGLITGPAFSLSYALFAIPISKLSDAKNRVVIISSAIVVWSAFTAFGGLAKNFVTFGFSRSEEHTSELQSLMRISYAVFCLKKKKKISIIT